uniref:TUG ubiquitin-like domain-containing protein n=1 Tax=Anopheles funestus TaxID=62324 RepID=A0A182RHL6_ANOFN
MATRSVTVLTVHGRRQTVKVEPDMTILEILETVCRKYNFPHDEYDLLHHNKVLDLTIMFRFAGIPNNALLEMAKAKQIRTEDEVIVQLQLEDGTRSNNGTYKPSQTLLDVLLELCPAKATAEAHPVLVYMRREVYWEQLGKTTLKSLGLTRGRAALRLLQRRAEEPKMQANVSAPLPQPVRREEPAKPVTTVPLSEAATSDAASPPVAVNPEPDTPSLVEAVVPEPKAECPPERIEATKAVAEEEQPEKMNVPTDDTMGEQQETDTPRPEAQITILGGRDAVLYHASTAEREQADVADSFFDLTVPEMMQLYKQLQDRVKSFEDAPLLTGELRELERNQQLLSNMNRYRQAVIRVQFPDHTTPPKVVLQPTVSLLDAGCFPQVLLHFSYNPGPSDNTIVPAGFCLQPELLGRLSNATGAAVVAMRAKRNTTTGTGSSNEQNTTAASNTESAVSTTQEPMVAGPSNRIPHRNFRQSSSPSTTQTTSEREAKILKFLKK